MKGNCNTIKREIFREKSKYPFFVDSFVLIVVLDIELNLLVRFYAFVKKTSFELTSDSDDQSQ